MVIQLPIEVWMDVLDWLRAQRRQLAAKYNKLGDRTFNEFLQHWLHKYTRNVQLGYLEINSFAVFDCCGRLEKRAELYSLKMHSVCGKKVETRVRVPFADVPLPENITALKGIRIKYLDYVVLNFLRQMPMFRSINNSSSNNNILSMSICFADTRVMQLALGYLMPQPLFNGIGAFNFWADTYNLFPHFLDNFRNNFLPAKFLYLDAAISVPTVNPIVRWLSTRVTDSEPRIASIQKSTVLIWRNLSEAIRQQILTATSPVSFFVRIRASRSPPLYSFPEEKRFENEETGEQLILRRQGRRQGTLVIGRCPASVDAIIWLREMDQKAEIIPEWKESSIMLDHTELGPLESAEAEEEEDGGNDDNDDDAQEPGPSKRRRLT